MERVSALVDALRTVRQLPVSADRDTAIAALARLIRGEVETLLARIQSG